MLDGMFDAIARPLAFFYDVLPSYGVAIMLLTLAVMVLLTPLTISGTKSMINMQRMQPELKKIQEKHKDDREKLNAEMMAFYQEHNINPVMGCLPMLLQIPVFLILFNVVRGLTNRAGGLGSGIGSAVRQSGADAGALTSWDPPFSPNRLDPTSQLYQDLSRDTEMNFLGFDLAESAQSALGQGVLVSLPFLIMIVIVGVTSWYQQRQIQARTSTSNTRSKQNDQQQMIMKIMPWMLPVFSFTMPAALVLYFIVSNLYRVGQQAFITRSIYGDSDDSGDSGKKKSSGSGSNGKNNTSKAAVGGNPGWPGKGGKSKAANQRSNQRRERAKSASGSPTSITPRERTNRRKKRN